MSELKLPDLLEMDMGEVIDWLVDNAHKYDLVSKSNQEEHEEEFYSLTSKVERLTEALKLSTKALESSYDATEWPCNGKSKQEVQTKANRELLNEIKGE